MPSSTAYTALLMSLLLGANASYVRIPDDIKDFMSAICGRYDNVAQIQAGSTEHDHIQVTMKIIELTALQFRGVATMYFEFVVNGEVVQMHICHVIKDTSKRGTFAMIPYNFTDPSQYRPFQFDVTTMDILLIGKTLVTNPAYVIYITKQKDGSYCLKWPDSRSIIYGKFPAYTVIITCEAYSSTVPLFTNERSAPSPYVYQKTHRCRSPFGGSYESFCDKLHKRCPLLGINLGLGILFP